jgi:8-oxo-dGTP diphosphatase
MEPARSWTGREATALRKALRMSTDRFAARLRVAPRTVANWAAHPDMVPRAGVQDELDRLLNEQPATLRADFDGGPAQGAVQALRVAIAIVVRDEHVLLVRRRDDTSGLSWQFPAGIIKPGETGEDVAVRETLNETGVHCATKEHLGRRIHPVTGVQCDYYWCEYLAGDAENRDSVENAGVVWAPQIELTKFVPRENVYPPVLAILEEAYAAGA